MAATTPYQQNDYQAVSNFRPYQLPVNDVFKALQAQNQFWEDGARRVKSVYDNALNLKLSLEPNREIRKKFMEEAEKQLTKLSSMDLSDPSVQKQGFDVFKPLFQDEGVMSDDQATRWIDDVQSDIQRAREQDNGKGYADSNAMVAMEGVYEFKNAKDRMAGKSYLQNKRSFTPYYDPSKEMSDILKNCKGPTVSSTMPGQAGEMYLHTQEAAGASPARVESCLNAGLSARAKDQIGIDGYAAYMTGNRIDHPEGKNYQALRDDYVSSYKASLDSITEDIGDVDGKLIALQNAYNQTKDSRYLEMKKGYEDTRGKYLDKVKNLNDSYAQLSAGNLDFIKKNYGQLAEHLYIKKQLGLYGEAFSTDKIEDKYSADAVRLQQQRLVYDEAKLKSQQLHDEKMADIDFKNNFKLEQLKGTIKGKKIDPQTGQVIEDLVPVDPAFTEEDKKSVGYKDFVAEKEKITKDMDDNNLELFNTLKRKYPKEMENYTDVKTFFAEGPANSRSPALSFLDTHGRIGDDPTVAKWSKQSGILTTNMKMLNAYESAAEQEVKQAVPSAFDRSTIRSKFAPITLSDGTVINSDQVLDALEGKSSSLQITLPNATSRIASPTTGITTDSYTPAEIKINGKTYNITRNSKDAKLWEYIRDIRYKQTEDISALNSKRDEVYGRTMLTIRPDVYAEANNNDKEDPTRRNIMAAVGAEKIDDIQIIKKDPTTGVATVRIQGTKTNPISNDFAKKNLSGITFVDEAPKFEESGNSAVLEIKSPYLIDARATSNPMTVLQMGLERISQNALSPLSSLSKKQPGELIEKIPVTTEAYNGTDFQIEIIKTISGVKYEVKIKNKNDVISADGTIIQKKGEFSSSEQVFTDTNQLLGYINGTTKF